MLFRVGVAVSPGPSGVCLLTPSSDPFEYYMFFFALGLISQKVQKEPPGKGGQGPGLPHAAGEVPGAHSNCELGFPAAARVPACPYFRLRLFHPGGQIPVLVSAHRRQCASTTDLQPRGRQPLAGAQVRPLGRRHVALSSESGLPAQARCLVLTPRSLTQAGGGLRRASSCSLPWPSRKPSGPWPSWVWEPACVLITVTLPWGDSRSRPGSEQGRGSDS